MEVLAFHIIDGGISFYHRQMYYELHGVLGNLGIPKKSLWRQCMRLWEGHLRMGVTWAFIPVNTPFAFFYIYFIDGLESLLCGP